MKKLKIMSMFSLMTLSLLTSCVSAPKYYQINIIDKFVSNINQSWNLNISEKLDGKYILDSVSLYGNFTGDGSILGVYSFENTIDSVSFIKGENEYFEKEVNSKLLGLITSLHEGGINQWFEGDKVDTEPNDEYRYGNTQEIKDGVIVNKENMRDYLPDDYKMNFDEDYEFIHYRKKWNNKDQNYTIDQGFSTSDNDYDYSENLYLFHQLKTSYIYIVESRN